MINSPKMSGKSGDLGMNPHKERREESPGNGNDGDFDDDDKGK